MDTVTYLLSWVSWIIGGIWAGANWLFGLHFIGWFIQLAFYIALGWVVYKVYRKVLPTRVQEAVKNNVRPAASWMTTPMRWYLVQWLANPEWLRQRGDPVPKQVEKPAQKPAERRVPRRRTVREVLWSGFRWFLLITAIELGVWYWVATTFLNK